MSAVRNQEASLVPRPFFDTQEKFFPGGEKWSGNETIKKRPLLGDCLSTTTNVISIRNMECVRCREDVHFSEDPLSDCTTYISVFDGIC